MDHLKEKEKIRLNNILQQEKIKKTVKRARVASIKVVRGV